ncbi:hypothetical protein BD289DRAFT_93322 [Coniella lustricola]|uniref:Uncharacterized protein n=1 Tax=Coniella lustricola TaxID=2025994 RepID=A0A2T2ZYF3_9PEZI|nr:hypothetical protein BD289DRAFT_93322 [Coniella lustricola]
MASSDRATKTTIWVPKEAFAAVQRLWKPEFNWVPVPVDRSLPPTQIAYIDTTATTPAGGRPISPLPPVPRMLPRTPRTPLLPLLETSVGGGGGYFGVGMDPDQEHADRRRRYAGRDENDAVFKNNNNTTTTTTTTTNNNNKQSPVDLDTATTSQSQTRLSALLLSSPDRPDTPSTATEPESPATPKDGVSPPAGPQQPFLSQQQQQRGGSGGGVSKSTTTTAYTLPQPTLFSPEHKDDDNGNEADDESPTFRPTFRPTLPSQSQSKPAFNALHGLPHTSSPSWRMIDTRSGYAPQNAHLLPASWKTLDKDGEPRDLAMTDHWETRRWDEARWERERMYQPGLDDDGAEEEEGGGRRRKRSGGKGFAVRLDMHLNIEVEMRGSVNGDITLSAEALYAL